MPETESTQLVDLDAPTAAVVNALYPNETLDEIPPIVGDIRVQTARHAIGAYLAAMTPQHPAAPETETDANGLTEAEREALSNTVRDVMGRSYGFEAICRQVERIVAERVRVVEGERDAAREQGTRLADGLYRWRDDAERYLARAESAEAAHEAEKAAHERLRAGVEATHAKVAMHPHEDDCLLPEDHRDEWDFDGEFCPVCEPDWFACPTCRDEDGSMIEWPCETALLLGGGEAR